MYYWKNNNILQEETEIITVYRATNKTDYNYIGDIARILIMKEPYKKGVGKRKLNVEIRVGRSTTPNEKLHVTVTDGKLKSQLI